MIKDSEWRVRNEREKPGFMFTEFLQAYQEFRGIYSEYERILEQNDGEIPFRGHGLFKRIKSLENKFILNIKSDAHFLFRGNGESGIEERYNRLEELLSSGGQEAARPVISELTLELTKERIDQTIGESFHDQLRTLRESLYIVEEYGPRYEREQRHSERLRSIAESKGYELSEEEKRELSHLEQLDERNREGIEKARRNVMESMPALKERFEQIAEVLRHYLLRLTDERTLDVLGKNLKLSRDLVIETYGEEGAKELFLAAPYKPN